MTPITARSRHAPDTTYLQFRPVRSSKDSIYVGDVSNDADLGASPVSRWLAYAFDHADLVSNAAGTAWVAQFQIPHGSFVIDHYLRLDEEFDGTGANAVDIGDSNDTDGWAVNLDLTAAPGTTPTWHRDADAAYVNKASNVSAGVSGGQYYQYGGVIEAIIATTVPTKGKAIAFFEIISYHEDQDAEW